MLVRLLDSEAVEEVLGEMARYMPNTDPRQALISDPTWLTRMERCAPRRPKPYHSGLRAQSRFQIGSVMPLST